MVTPVPKSALRDVDRSARRVTFSLKANRVKEFDKTKVCCLRVLWGVSIGVCVPAPHALLLRPCTSHQRSHALVCSSVSGVTR